MLLWRSLTGKNILAALSQKSEKPEQPKASPKPVKQLSR